jgi:high-affinity Fe2+/Pb2+ permease
MKKEKTLVAEITKIEDIMALATQYEQAVKDYVSQFTKTTNGTQSMGDSGYEFSMKCQVKKDMFPEILPGTFDADDFDLKMTGLLNLNQIRKQNEKINRYMEEATKICKTDGKFYANEFYSMIKKESSRSAKYKTTVDELMPFYKKSTTEKSDLTKLDTAKSN